MTVEEVAEGAELRIVISNFDAVDRYDWRSRSRRVLRRSARPSCASLLDFDGPDGAPGASLLGEMSWLGRAAKRRIMSSKFRNRRASFAVAVRR